MSRFFAAIAFLLFYISEVVKSNLRVAHDVLTPRHHMKPGLVKVDVSDMTDWQCFFMANFITMTPGTLGITLSADRKELLLHAMYIDGDEQTLATALRNSYGTRIRRVF